MLLTFSGICRDRQIEEKQKQLAEEKAKQQALDLEIERRRVQQLALEEVRQDAGGACIVQCRSFQILDTGAYCASLPFCIMKIQAVPSYTGNCTATKVWKNNLLEVMTCE